MPARQRRNVTLRMLVGPLVFVVPIPIAFVAPGQSEYVWLMVWVLNLAISRMMRRERGQELAG